MKKRILAVLLGISLLPTSLIGYGTQNVSASEGNDEELTEIIWYWPSTGVTYDGLQDVENALNARMEPDIGVHVTLEPIAFGELVNQLTLDVSSGEQVDLSLAIGANTGSLVQSNLIQPIGELVEKYGQAIAEDCGGAEDMFASYYNGEMYGVCPPFIQGDQYGFIARKDILDKYEIAYDPEKTYTLDELEEIFAIIKAGEGEDFYCMRETNIGVGTLGEGSGAAFALDKCGTNTASGVLMLDEDFNTTTIVNLYETDEYKEYAERLYRWAQNGYISKDAMTNQEDWATQMASGKFLGYFAWTTPGTAEQNSRNVGKDLVAFTTVPGYRASDNVSAYIQWNVPTTSANPEKAIQVMNYIYEHEECAWMLQFGLEGISYEVVEQTEEGILIDYLNEDPASLPYYMPYGVYGNRLGWPVTAPNGVDYNANLKAFNDSITESGDRISAILGYQYNLKDVETEYAAVETVLAQYLPVINTGAADPAEVLPEFQDALKAAGIDKIIAENQEQLNEWMATK